MRFIIDTFFIFMYLKVQVNRPWINGEICQNEHNYNYVMDGCNRWRTTLIQNFDHNSLGDDLYTCTDDQQYFEELDLRWQMTRMAQRLSSGNYTYDEHGDCYDEERWLFIEDLLQNLHW